MPFVSHMGSLFIMSPAMAADVHFAGIDFSSEGISAIGGLIAAILTAAGGIFVAYTTRSGANVERGLQEKLAAQEAELVVLKKDLIRVREERDAVRIAAQLSEQECINDKNRLWTAGSRAIHNARKVLFNAVIAGKLDSTQWELPDFPEFDAILNPKE